MKLTPHPSIILWVGEKENDDVRFVETPTFKKEYAENCRGNQSVP